jgi:GGDEF domain-containing protein
MQQGPPRLRRARPVADAPVDALLLRAEDLAKGWLLALLEQAPLDDAPAILAADLARDGPRLCSAVVRALADESDLRRLEPGGALEQLVSQTGEIAGSRGVEATARAVETLRAVIWSAVRAELSQPDADQVAELSERLTLVIELVRAAALRHSAELAPSAALRGAPAPSAHVSPGPVSPVSPVPPAPPSPEPVRRDPVGRDPARPEREEDSLWKGALADEIRLAEQTGAPLSLLLVELEDADRVLAVEPLGEATATFGRFAQALRSALRRQDILACETGTRAWVIARETSRLGAHSVAARMVAAVGAAPPWRGAPLTVTVGFGVLGEDGADVEALVEAAEEARFAAAANGSGVIPMDQPPRPDIDRFSAGPGPDLAG